MARPRSDARDRVLAQVIDHVTEHGLAGLSLRELASAIGTSHRMLVYHFGSKEGLLAEVVRTVEAGQRAQIEALAAQLSTTDQAEQREHQRANQRDDQRDEPREEPDRASRPDSGPAESAGTAVTSADVADHIRAMWAHLVDPATQRQERLFFAMVGMALQGDPAMRPLLDDLITPWLAPVTEIRRRQGVPDDEAAADARLALAVTRGLLLDLLATGDVDATTRAFERFGDLLARGEAARPEIGARSEPRPAGSNALRRSGRR